MRFWNENYRANDIDILKYVSKKNQNYDFAHDRLIPGIRQQQKYETPGTQPRDGLPMRPLVGQQGRRMTDMSNPLAPVSSRGFAFVSELPNFCVGRYILNFK